MLRTTLCWSGAAMLCAACGPAPSSLAPFLGANNSAVLTGATVGGSASNDLLRKELTVTVAGPSVTLPVGRAFAMRAKTTTESTYLLVEVSNAGKSASCFIRTTQLDLQDSAGATVQSVGSAYVQGSVGDMGTTGRPILTDTCLAPGENGWLLTIASASSGQQVFSRAESLVFRWANSSDTPPVMPPPKLSPTAYSVTTTGAVAVDFSNTGTGDALMSGHFSKYVLLDGEGLPRLWGFLTERTTPAGGLISVGGGGSVEGRPSEFGGSATALRAILDFNVAPPGGLVGDATVRPSADGDVDRWSGWNADQAQREARAASF
jgi:hypothetical protein